MKSLSVCAEFQPPSLPALLRSFAEKCASHPGFKVFFLASWPSLSRMSFCRQAQPTARTEPTMSVSGLDRLPHHYGDLWLVLRKLGSDDAHVIGDINGQTDQLGNEDGGSQLGERNQEPDDRPADSFRHVRRIYEGGCPD
jgi:hypothetical protein